MVKPGILPVAEPLVLVPVLGVAAVHVAQTKVSALASGVAMAAQAVKINADAGLRSRPFRCIGVSLACPGESE